MHRETAYLPVDLLHAFIRDVFTAQGASEPDAATVSDVLISADLRGVDTHGISRLQYYRDRIKGGVTKPSVALEVVRETPSTAVIDGHHGLGHVIGVRAMEMAISKARAVGLGAVSVRNSTHYGIAGYYPLMAVAQGMIGLSTTNARPAVVPTHSTEPKYGTNPLAFGAPTDEACPFLYDASMAVTQRGKIEVAQRLGKPLPKGHVIDREGHSLTDASMILDALKQGEAAMLPLGGAREALGSHKGYGISIILEILSSALQGGSFLSGLSGGDKEGQWKTYNLGHFFMAIDAAAFVEPDEFRQTTGRIVRELRAATQAPDAERIWTAGEKEWETERRRRTEGIPVTPPLQDELCALRDELDLTFFRFPFEPEA